MKILNTAIASALLFAAVPTHAADLGNFYVGAGLGVFGVNDSGFNADANGWKLMGGWMPLPYVGAELEYIDGGTVKDKGLEIDPTGANLSVKGNFPIGEKFDVFAKLGYFFWDADERFEGISHNDSGSDFSYGIGADFNFTEHFGVMTEYQWFKLENADSDMWSLSAFWKF